MQPHFTRPCSTSRFEFIASLLWDVVDGCRGAHRAGRLEIIKRSPIITAGSADPPRGARYNNLSQGPQLPVNFTGINSIMIHC